ncbi:MAG: YbaK/EbsC family protein [Clostridia bacterium]|nr:YbaK/EbsC family protein [Clostridia bacterium]
MEEKIIKVCKFLDENNLEYVLIRHEAVVTCEQSREVINTPDCCACKNLFVTDRRAKRLYLIVLKSEKQADLKFIAQSVGAGRLEFCTDEELHSYLGVIRGAVSPLALIDDKNKIRLVVDVDVLNAEKVRFHPMDNTATVILTKQSFESYLKAIKKYVMRLNTADNVY